MPRKKPFSVKQKKKQLQEKRNRKRAESPKRGNVGGGQRSDDGSSDESAEVEAARPTPMDMAVTSDQIKKGYDPNRYRLQFEKESRADIAKRKKRAMRPYDPLPESALEVDLNAIYQPGSALDMPKRPSWDYRMSRQNVEAQEERMFDAYLENIYTSHPFRDLSYFELNLETWRQLWRVLEMSDVILLITDIRHPALHFSPALYDYVIKDLKKHIILVLNKIDLAPPSLVTAWHSYFSEKFPDVHIVCFTSFPNKEGTSGEGPSNLLSRKRPRNFKAAGPLQLHAACETICQGEAETKTGFLTDYLTSPHPWLPLAGLCVLHYGARGSGDGEGQLLIRDHQLRFFEHMVRLPGNNPVHRVLLAVDLTKWKQKIEAEMDGDESKPAHVLLDQPTHETPAALEEHEFYKDGMLTIGCVGHPNVGKSSIINGLCGRKVVSASRTPGHTKHFQTIFLTPTVKLCDSPGIVFPSLVDKQLQILSGIFPIAQVREPYTPVGYLAQRTPLVETLKITHPDADDEPNPRWSAFDICDAWAEKRGFMTAKAARRDVYRAANSILRLAVEGRLCLNMAPTGYHSNKEVWEQHPYTQEIIRIQENFRDTKAAEEDGSETSFSDDSDCRKESESSSSDDLPKMSSNKFALLGDG